MPPVPRPRQSRNASTLLIEDTLTWLRGKHSFSMGGSWTQYDLWLKNQQLVPNLSLGATGGGLPNLATGDPAQAMFTQANFPGASAAQLNQAQALYAIITGRVTSICGERGTGRRQWSVRIPRPLDSALSHAGGGVLRSGLLADPAGPDDQCGPSLRAAVPVHAAKRQLFDRHGRQLLRPLWDEPGYFLQSVPGG